MQTDDDSPLTARSPAAVGWWQSRQVVVTPEVLGLHSAAECQQRVEQLGLTPLPCLLHRQEHWRLDLLLVWSRANGFDGLPILGRGSATVGSIRRAAATRKRT
jgi:hypothetical protein